MIDRVATFIENEQLIDPMDKVLVAVSGGVDSMTLINILRSLDFDVSVAHMNFQLREEASNQDEEFVKNWCDMHEIACHTRRVDTIDVAEKDQISTQMAARQLRYDWFQELCKEHGYKRIATAHHLNDSLETVLLNLTKGTGIRGLAGIPATNGKVIRPFLEISKEEILAYAKESKLKWREDASNADTKYQRNLIRNEVVPLLEKINPSLIETFISTGTRMTGTNELIQQLVETIRNENFAEGGQQLNMLWYDGSAGHVVVLSELLRPYGVSYSQACDIGKNHPSGKIFYTTTHQIVYDRDRLVFNKVENLSIEPIDIESSEGKYIWGKCKISIENVNSVDIKFDNSNVAYFDAGKIVFPIKIRQWSEGDWFIPFGMKGKKKVSDFFIDTKIPLTLKNRIPIFESGGNVIWIGGYRVDDRYKVGDSLMRCIKITVD